MEIKKVSVVGAGTMGTQISMHIARYGYEVSVYARDPEKFLETLKKILSLMKNTGRVPAQTLEEWEEGVEKVRLCNDLGESLRDTDLVIEALSEDLGLKRKVFARMNSLVSQDAILSTASSSIPISKIEDIVQKPERCLNLHFYQVPMIINMVDIMGGTKTAAEVMETGKRFVQSVGCIPLMVKREILGFCFGRLIHSTYCQVLYMWGGGYADFQDIDRGWMIFTQMPRGPFGIMDTIGLDVVYDLLMVYYNESKYPKDHPPQTLKDMIDRKELGVKTGKGFYTYPNPEYARPDFLKR
jgi:3-hydroxybutyryl-CoA dehydrogenase